MDICDQAQQQIEENEAHMLANIRLEPEAESTGECLECGELVEMPKRWCSVSCRDQWTYRKSRGGV